MKIKHTFIYVCVVIFARVCGHLCLRHNQ